MTASRLKKTRLPAFLSKKKRLQYHTSCTKSSTWPTDKWTPPRFGPTPLPIIFFSQATFTSPPTDEPHPLIKKNKQGPTRHSLRSGEWDPHVSEGGSASPGQAGYQYRDGREVVVVPLGGGARTLAQSSVRHTTRLFFFLSLFLAFFFLAQFVLSASVLSLLFSFSSSR